MPALLLRFAIVLESVSVEPCDRVTGERRHGPLFHKWLPNGEGDAIDLNVDEPEAELRVWFEQNGFIESGRLKFDYERKELEPAIIAALPVLDAGPLIGSLRLPNLAEEVLEAIQEGRTGDRAYVAFGRRVAHLLYVPIARLLSVLRTNYGQYWINELKEWNPRTESLGSYFNLVLQTRWSVDEGVTWSDFIPDPPELFSASEGWQESYRALLTQQDWRELQKNLTEGYEPKLAARLLSMAHQLIEHEDLRGAVVQVMNALEVGINEFMHRKTRMNKVMADHLHDFARLPLGSRLTAVATLSGILSATQVEAALKVADLHQKVVRDGWEPPASTRAEIEHAMQTVSALLAGPAFRFPSYYTEAPVLEVVSAPAQTAAEPVTA